jgi:DNA-binding SARP family transcriptional activator
MRFQVLGPLEVVGCAGPVRVLGKRRRALLGTLLINAGSVVTLQELVDSVWAEEPPESALFNLRTYVWDLRGMLQRSGDSRDRLLSHPAGYRLDASETELDLLGFRARAAEGRTALAQGDYLRAAASLGTALDHWRGCPLADLAQPGTRICARTVALQEERWSVTSLWVDARLRLGQHDDLIPLLTQTVAEYPLHERFRQQLMIALHAAGRTADALASYREARKASIDELGVEPGQALQQAHQAILCIGREQAMYGQR